MPVLQRYRSWITLKHAADDRKLWDFRISSQAWCNVSCWRCSSITRGAQCSRGSAVFSSTKDGHVLFFFPFPASYSERGLCPEETEGELGPAPTPITAPLCIRERRRGEYWTPKSSTIPMTEAARKDRVRPRCHYKGEEMRIWW